MNINLNNFILGALFIGSTGALASEKYSSASFDALLEKKENILVHVHADWCPTCKVQKKNLTQVESKNFVNVEVSFDENKDFTKKYKVIQQSTFLAFAGGKEIARSIGITKTTDIQNFVDSSFGSSGGAVNSLQSKLDEKRDGSKAPPEVQKTMSDATEALRKSGLVDKAKKKGDKFIDFELPNAIGGKIKLSDALKKGAVILTFYRGGWCPYCNLQLRAYQESLEDFKKMGAQLIAVSPESSESADTTVNKNDLKFSVLSDEGNAVARKYGLVFKVSDDLKNIYKSFGIDLEKNQKNNSWELPIPATYVINKQGKVVYSFLNVDYTQRAEPADILKSLQ
jgi:peroxiredoxin